MEDFSQFSEREKKIYNAIFQSEENEFFAEIKKINELLAASNNDPLPPFASLPIKKGISIFRLQTPFYVAAAAILLATLGLVLVSYLADSKPQNPQVKIANLRNQILLDGNSVAANQPLSVQQGSSLQSGENSSVDILFAQGTSVRLLPNSSLVLQKMDLDQNQENIILKLEQGTAYFHVNKKKKYSGLLVLTRFANVLVRGTKFLVTSSQNQISVAVKEGRVAVVKSRDGMEAEPSGEQILEPGQQIIGENQGFKRNRLDNKHLQLFQSLQELDTEPVSREKQKRYNSKEEIISEFKRLEKVTLANGKILTGAIVDMNDTDVTVQTLQGEVKIDRSMLVEVEQIE